VIREGDGVGLLTPPLRGLQAKPRVVVGEGVALVEHLDAPVRLRGRALVAALAVGDARLANVAAANGRVGALPRCGVAALALGAGVGFQVRCAVYAQALVADVAVSRQAVDVVALAAVVARDTLEAFQVAASSVRGRAVGVAEATTDSTRAADTSAAAQTTRTAHATCSTRAAGSTFTAETS
jgi:hypothetical protein